MSEHLAAIEKSLASLSQFFNEAPALLSAAQKATMKYKKGQIGHEELDKAVKPLIDAFHNAQFEDHSALNAAHFSLMMDCLRNDVVQEWESSDKVFVPKTGIENDLWTAFHACKNEGYRYVVMYGDSFSNTYPIKPVAKWASPHEALDELAKIPMTKIMAVLDTQRDFAAQWPYVPGLTFAPIQLMNNPVICLPEDARNHPDFKPLYDRPAHFVGVVEGRKFRL